MKDIKEDHKEKEKMIFKYPKPVSIEGTQKILEQMKKCVCKIFLVEGGRGTGFFLQNILSKL